MSPSLFLPFLLLLPFSSTWPGDPCRCSSGGSGTVELDDEPPCLEEIDYGPDSSSDREGSCSELDRQIREWASLQDQDEGEEEEQEQEQEEEEEGLELGRRDSP